VAGSRLRDVRGHAAVLEPRGGVRRRAAALGERRRGRLVVGRTGRDPPGDDIERELDRLGIGDLEEAVDRAEVARVAVLEVQDPIRSQAERFLDAVLDDDDGAALVARVRRSARSRSAWPGRGSPAVRR
jgi:hypothetical protein